MDNFNFTKAFVNTEKKTTTSSSFVKMNDLNRIERINDNMHGINPYLKTKQEKPIIKEEKIESTTDIYRNRINALNNIKKD